MAQQVRTHESRLSLIFLFRAHRQQSFWRNFEATLDALEIMIK